MTRLVIAVCSIALLVVAAASAGAATRFDSARAAATAAAAPPVTPGSTYLALGDSVTFGFEEAQVVPAPDYHDAASFVGYPEQLGSELHLKVVNLACPGETSASLIDPSAQSNGCENAPGVPHKGYRTEYPLHVRYHGAQLADAVAYLRSHHDVRLVSLMIGANDYFVCTETTKDSCAAKSELRAVVAEIGSNVRRILSAIRSTAHYDGQLAIVNYYSLNYAVPATNAESMLLNTTVDAAARPYHVVIANGFAALRTAARHFGGNTCDAGLLTELGKVGTCGIHPSYAGAALLAQSLEKVLTL